MPLYDYRCRACEARFEQRASVGEEVSCPECGEPGAERTLSGFAGPFHGGLRGLAARRSNATRSAREEQRRERREQRRQSRAQGE